MASPPTIHEKKPVHLPERRENSLSRRVDYYLAIEIKELLDFLKVSPPKSLSRPGAGLYRAKRRDRGQTEKSWLLFEGTDTLLYALMSKSKSKPP